MSNRMVSRVVEKGSAHTICLMGDLIDYLTEQGALAEVDEAMWFTDAGPHYASRLTYSRMASHWTDKAKKANGSSLKALPNGARNYGYCQWRKKTGIEYQSKDTEGH